MGRAMAHGQPWAGAFSDPTALALLSDEARALVTRFRAEGFAPKNGRERAHYESLRHRAYSMVARTLAIDEAVREAAAPQVVILGAGLDGRAFRMPELRDAVVFEVDHPASQREKRARVGALTRTAREVRFVPVDFTRDSLERALAEAGHDPTLPTTWIWEGVVMYLTAKEIEATLAVLSRRSSPGSRLIVVYFVRALMLYAIRPWLRLVGEPVRSVHTVGRMRTLLASHRFRVARDVSVPEIGVGITTEIARGTRRLGHLRVVTAGREDGVGAVSP